MKCHCHYVFLLRFVFTIAISFSLHAMLPLLANKDECIYVLSDGLSEAGTHDEPFGA